MGGNLPVLPAGYNELGQRVKTDHSNYSRSNSQTTPIVSEISNPLPPVPPGFSLDGHKIDDINDILPSKDVIHPNHGTLPPTEDHPEMAFPQRSYTTPDENSTIITDLNILVNRLQTELKLSKETLVQYECEIAKLRLHNEELLIDNKRLSSAKNQLESQMSVLNGTSPMRSSNGMGGAMTPHSKYPPNWSSTTQTVNSHVYNSRSKRNTEPYLNYDAARGYTHRQSEPNMLSIPTRPTKLPLNKSNGGIRAPNSQPTSYSGDHSPLYDSDTYPYFSRQSPGSDTMPRERTIRAKMTSSGDDLTSGGEDRNSVRSFESGNSGNVTLTGQNTTETVV